MLAGVFNECLALKRTKEKDEQVGMNAALNWYFNTVGVIFVLGRAFAFQHEKIIVRSQFLLVTQRFPTLHEHHAD